MTHDREEQQQRQSGTDNPENTGPERKQQFNEMTELSLEVRMRVADQIGVPIANADDANETGAMGFDDEPSRDYDEQVEEQGQDHPLPDKD